MSSASSCFSSALSSGWPPHIAAEAVDPMTARAYGNFSGGYGPFYVIPRINGKEMMGKTARMISVNFSSGERAEKVIGVSKKMLSDYHMLREQGQKPSLLHALRNSVSKSSSINPLQTEANSEDVEAFHIYPTINGNYYLGELAENIIVDFSSGEEASQAINLFQLAVKSHQVANLSSQVDGGEDALSASWCDVPQSHGSAGRSSTSGKAESSSARFESTPEAPKNYSKTITPNKDGTTVVVAESWEQDGPIPPLPDGWIDEPVVFYEGNFIVRNTLCSK